MVRAPEASGRRVGMLGRKFGMILVVGRSGGLSSRAEFRVENQ